MANEEDGTFYAAETENGPVYLAGFGKTFIKEHKQ